MSSPIPRIDLPILRIELAHKNGVEVFDPTGIAMEFLLGTYTEKSYEPLDGPWGRDSSPIESVLSGEPALVYRTSDLQIPSDTRGSAPDRRPEPSP